MMRRLFDLADRRLIVGKVLRLAFVGSIFGVLYFVTLSIISYSQTSDHDRLTRLQGQFDSHMGDVEKRLVDLATVQNLVAENTTKLAVLQEQTSGLIRRMDTIVYALWGLSLGIVGQLVQWVLATWRRKQ